MISIPETEHRGITLRQLKTVCNEIEQRCVKEKWKRFGNPITKPEDVNLYDLNTNFLMPQTKASKCSYVELVASNPQPPRWFVSHWWGEPIYDFVRCISKHAFDRNIDQDTPYWVCAYANNQHNLAEDIGDGSLQQSSFFRALRISQGVVSIVDKQLTCFTRVWCAFEISIALQHLANLNLPRDQNSNQKSSVRHLLYDVYTHTIDGKDAVGLTDGVVASDKYPRNEDGSLDTRAKTFESNFIGMRSVRQANFPPVVCIKALEICIEKAEASVESDRRNILNYIVGRKELGNRTPPETHPSYSDINSLVQSKFALASYRRTLESNQDVTNHRNVISKAPLREIQLSFHGTAQFRKEAEHFVLALPETLETLDFKYSYQLFEDSKEFASGFRRLGKLKFFKFDCSQCTLKSCSVLWEEIGHLEKLQSLDVNCSYCGLLETIGGLGRSIAKMKHLEMLKLNFSFCSKVKDISVLLEGLRSCGSDADTTSNVNLLSLDLNFKGSGVCDENVIEFCDSLSLLNSNIGHLNLEFSNAELLHFDKIQNIEDLQNELKVYKRKSSKGLCSCSLM